MIHVIRKGSRKPRRSLRGGLLILVGLLVVGLGAALDAPAPSWARTSWNALEPAGPGHATACIHVGGSEVSYCIIRPDQPVELSLRGPGRLRLLSRHLPIDGRTGRRCYTIRVEQDGKLLETRPLLAGESRNATLCNHGSAPVGASRETVVAVPDGRHSYRVSIVEPEKNVGIRFFRERKRAAVRYANFAPREFEGVCTLVRAASGNQYAHYRFSGEAPLRFTVNGPTRLVMRTRLDFAPGEKTEATYGLEILRQREPDGDWEPVASPSHTTTPLAGSTYKECPRVVPGESRRDDIDVPEGTWTYELRAVDAGERGLTARILIPKADLGLGN